MKNSNFQFFNKKEQKKMTKKSKGKLLLIALFAALLASSAYVSLPLVHAAEPDIQDEMLTVLSNVVGLKTELYATRQSSQRDSQYISLPQKEADLFLASGQGTLRASCSFVKNQL
jgi:hypothetical protein